MRSGLGGTVTVCGSHRGLLCAGGATEGVEASLMQGLRREVEMLSSLSPICSMKWWRLSCKTV